MINTIYTFVQKLCPKLSQAFIYVSWFTYGMCFLSFILNKPFSFIWILPYIMIVFLSLYLICVVALKTMPSLTTNIQIRDKPGNGFIPQKADEERIKTLSDKYKSIVKRCLKCFEYFTAISIWPIISFWGTPLFSDVPTNITIGFTFTALLLGLIVAVVAFVNIKGFIFADYLDDFVFSIFVAVCWWPITDSHIVAFILYLICAVAMVIIRKI